MYDNPLGFWTIDGTNFAALASNPHCQILFTVEPHQRILLSLLDSVFTNTSDCEKNYLQVSEILVLQGKHFDSGTYRTNKESPSPIRTPDSVACTCSTVCLTIIINNKNNK